MIEQYENEIAKLKYQLNLLEGCKKTPGIDGEVIKRALLKKGACEIEYLEPN